MGISREWVTEGQDVTVLREIQHHGYIVNFMSSLKVRLNCLFPSNALNIIIMYTIIEMYNVYDLYVGTSCKPSY